MTVQKTGVDGNTYKKLVIDAGAVYIGAETITAGKPDNGAGTLLGATRGGNVFELTREIRDMAPDGSRGKVKGFQRIANVTATLTVNLLEITEANIMHAIAGSNKPASSVVGGEIEETDYLDSVAIVGHISDPALPYASKPIIIRLFNCLVTGPFSLAMNPKDEAVITMVFEAHYAADALDTEPYEIIYPTA